MKILKIPIFIPKSIKLNILIYITLKSITFDYLIKKRGLHTDESDQK
jgi:hypothetical protein